MKAVRVAALAGLVVLAACGDRTTLTLRFQPAEGASFRYALEQEVGMRVEGDSGSADGRQDITITIAFTQSVRGPVEGGTEVRLRVDSVTMSSPQLPPQLMANAAGMLRGLETAIVFDSRMQAVRSSVADPGRAPPQLAAQIASSLRGASFPLPEGPVRVGETWTVEAPAPTGQIPGLSGPLMLTSRLRIDRFRVDGADTVVHIRIETRFPEGPITLDTAMAGGSVRIEGKLEGEQEYSLSRQTLVTSTLGGTVRTSVSGGMLASGTFLLEQRMSMRLLEDTPAP
jgi:hypothetical protein